MTGRGKLTLLGLAALGVAVQNVVFWTGGPDPAPDSGAWDVFDDDGDAAPGGPAPDPLSREAVEAYLAQLEGKFRNPFDRRALERGAVRAAGMTSGALPTLAGTLWSQGRRVAWIDGRPYVEGDVLDGYTVERIDTDRVVLRDDGRQLELEVGEANAGARGGPAGGGAEPERGEDDAQDA